MDNCGRLKNVLWKYCEKDFRSSKTKRVIVLNDHDDDHGDDDHEHEHKHGLGSPFC